MSNSNCKVEEANEDATNKSRRPTDQFYTVHILFFFIGLTHFIPLTFFLTATSYWMDKFRDINSNSTSYSERTTLQTYFAPLATMASTVPLVIFMLLTTIYGELVKCTTRILTSLIIIVVLFIVITGFIKMDTDDWQFGFFMLSLLLFAIVNAANAVFGVSALNIVSKFPNSCLNAFLAGEGIAGIFNSLLQILSLGIGTAVQDSALIYFLSGCTVVMFTMALYVFAKKIAYYNCYMQKPLKTSKKNIVSLAQMRDTVKLIWSSVVIFVFTSCATAATTPAVTQLVVSEFAGTGQWGDIYFVPVCSYLLNNTSELLGRSLASSLNLNISGPILSTVAFIRMVVFIPLIMLCNAWNRTHLPVVFPHDYQYIIIVVLFGLTRGYFYNAAFLNVRRLVPPERVEVAMSVLMTFVGITSGLSSPLSYLSVILL